jgi:signal transduction histidine kinase
MPSSSVAAGSSPAAPSAVKEHARPRPWLQGLNWKGFAVVFGFACANALRRKIQSSDLWEVPLFWLADVGNSTLTGLLVAILVVAAVVITWNRLYPRGWRLVVGLIVSVAASSAVGTTLLLLWEIHVFPADYDYGLVEGFPGTWLRYLVPGLLFLAGYAYFRRRVDASAAIRQLEADRAALRERMAEARLSVLQAQIEPHFLFNTLANLKRLYATDPASGARMLENLMRYLAVALPRMRENESTLDRERDLAEAYLNIQKIRMGRRLEFSFDIPEALRNAPMPSMMLLTLVENAIKHGLNPLPQGGYLRVSASVDARELSVQVADSGRGFIKSWGAGTGLANVRSRLQALYGSAGSLEFMLNEPRGVTAILAVPHRGTEGAS